MDRIPFRSDWRIHHAIFPPLKCLTAFLLLAAIALPATAQTPSCTKQTCTVVVTGNIIEGCGGDYLRFHLRRETTNPAITTYTSFGNVILDVFHSTILPGGA